MDKCTKCGQPAILGFTSIACSNKGCEHFDKDAHECFKEDVIRQMLETEDGKRRLSNAVRESMGFKLGEINVVVGDLFQETQSGAMTQIVNAYAELEKHDLHITAKHIFVRIPDSAYARLDEIKKMADKSLRCAYCGDLLLLMQEPVTIQGGNKVCRECFNQWGD